MAVVSQSLQSSSWTFSSITNNYERRVTSRKRGIDTDSDGGKRMQVDGRGFNKKAKTISSNVNVSDAFDTSNMFQDQRAPHEYLAGDWRYEPQDSTPNQMLVEEEVISSEAVNVDKVISILLEALNAQNDNKEESDKHHATYSHHRFTSPLSGFSDRTPFVRKAVGGSCRGKVDAGLQKWVLCKNHYDDIRSCHPSSRSAEWIEALHEMGWENLHPTYMSQSQQTFRTLTAFSTSCNDWVDVEVGGGQSSERLQMERSDETHNHDLEGIQEDVWDSGLQERSQRTLQIAA